MTRRSLLRQTAAACAIARILPAAAPGSNSDWLKDIYRELHLDAHFGQVTAPYETFDAESAAQILKDAGFQMVSYFAICNAGYCYFPTTLGVVHPGLKRDYTGELTAALKKRGIRVLAYVAVGPDRRFHKEHPDWITVRDASAPIGTARGDMAQMCTNSPWLEQAHIPQLAEIVRRYDVDGFFLDSLISKFVNGSCYCRYCRESFAAEEGGELPVAERDPKVLAHYRWLSRNGARYAGKVTASLTAIKPGLAFALNHVWVTRNPVKPPAAVTQLVWEPVPPYPGVHSLDFSLEGRYLSTQRGIANWSCMATRGNGWGDFSLRDPESYLHEAAVALAASGRPYFGDDNYPSGNPDPAVYRVYGAVNRRTAALEPFLKNCVPVKETAVLHSADSMWSGVPLNPPREWMGSPASAPVAGAHTMLAEEHAAFGILNSESLVESLAEHRVLVLPEQCILSAAECDAIRRFVEGGGALIATGDTGTRNVHNQPLPNLAIADVLGVRYLRRAEVRRSYLRAGPELAEFGVPAMDVLVNGAYLRVEAATATTLLPVVAPTGAKQAPAENPEGPGITMNRFGKGYAIYCAVPIFGAYFQDGTPVLRNLAAWMFRLVHPPASRSIALENAPLDVEVTCHVRGRDRLVHLVNFGGGRRMSGAQRAREFTAVHGIQVRVRCGARPKRVLLVPEGAAVAFEWRDGRAVFQAQPLRIHNIYMIENSEG